MANRPAVGASDWGTKLNAHLDTSINTDGSLKTAAISTAGGVLTTTDQTITGVKTFSPNTTPTYGAELAPGLGSWTLDGVATYDGTKITVDGDGGISCSISVTNGQFYEITHVGSRVGAYSNYQIELGSVVSPRLMNYDYLYVLQANTTGTVTVRLGAISGERWGVDITSVSIRQSSLRPASATIGGMQHRAVSGNILIGDTPGRMLTGTQNVLIGNNAAANMVIGNQCVAVGEEALVNNNGPSGQIAIGYQALRSNTTGSYNTAVGSNALYTNTTGGSNTANGASALRSNTTGSYNTAVGSNALYTNTTGGSNTANGASALRSNTTGSYNTAVGSNVLYTNITGGYNTANGHQALYSNTTGSSNTANGYLALRTNTTGGSNTANGASALRSNTTGGSNTANGVSALYAPLGNTSYATTTASNQTATGQESGQSSASQVDGISVYGYRAVAGAAYATAIGYQARADHSGGVALGNNTTTTATNQVMIGGRDLEITDAAKGVVIKSPDGTRWRVTIDNSGTLVTTSL